MNKTYEIKEICGDWELSIQVGNESCSLYFKSRNNAELVKAILEHEDSHPNEAVPYFKEGNLIGNFPSIYCGCCAHRDSPIGDEPCKLCFDFSNYEYCENVD